MRTFTKLLLVAFMLCIYSFGYAARYTITIYKDRCEPAALTVNKGDTVVFQWAGGGAASVSSAAWAAFALSSNNPVKELAAPFKQAGTVAFKTGSAAGTVTVLNTPGAREARQAVTMEAFPNPTSGQVQFSLSQLPAGNAKIRVSNSIGKTVYTLDVKETTAAHLTADLTDLPAGIYFYSLVVNDKMVETKRLVLRQ